MASFDRKVERNQMKMNKKGKGPNIKSGRTNQDPRTSLGPKGDGEIFRGRNLLLPFALVLLALLYAVVGLAGSTSQMNSAMFWITIVLYFFLALIIFLRRPYLRINKSWLYTTKYNRDKLIEANNISKIKIGRHKIMIVPKGKDVNWVFYRLRNRFDTKAMGQKLEQFAKAYNVHLEQDSK